MDAKSYVKKMHEVMNQDIAPFNENQTNAERVGQNKGSKKQGEEAGKYRAEASNDIGKAQLGLMNSDDVLNRMVNIVKGPVYQNMRNKIPEFQAKQLWWLKLHGTPEQKETIGNFTTTAENFIASTVQGFSGKPLVREFDLAQRQKINDNDSTYSAEGKLKASMALHKIAEKKMEIINDLLEKGYSEAKAVKQANKMVDVSAIEEETEKLLDRKITIYDKKTGEKKTVSIREARKLGVPNV